MKKPPTGRYTQVEKIYLVDVIDECNLLAKDGWYIHTFNQSPFGEGILYTALLEKGD